MTGRVLILLCIVFSLAADKKDPGKEELKKMQGTWKATKLIYNGGTRSLEGKDAISMKLQGDTAVVEAGEDVRKEYGKVQFKLDPTVMPASMDISILIGGQKGVTMEGIYKLDKDKLTVCAKVLGQDRPAKFESPAGESIVLLELQREKD